MTAVPWVQASSPTASQRNASHEGARPATTKLDAVSLPAPHVLALELDQAWEAHQIITAKLAGTRADVERERQYRARDAPLIRAFNTVSRIIHQWQLGAHDAAEAVGLMQAAVEQGRRQAQEITRQQKAEGSKKLTCHRA